MYVITEKEVDIFNQSKQQLVDLVNILNKAVTAEGIMAKSFIIQVAQNLNNIKPVVKKEEVNAGSE